MLRGRAITDISYLSERSLAALVALEDGTGLFLKQPIALRLAAGPYKEADLLVLISEHPVLARLREWIPGLVHYDMASRLLVTEGLRHHRSLRAHYGSRPPTDDTVLRLLARALAHLHVDSAVSDMKGDPRCPERTRIPVPTYGRITPTRFAHAVGSGFPKYLSMVQHCNDALRELRDSWSASCLIHGDLKDDNVLLHPEVPGGPSLKLVDWELAGWGEPLWDVGAMVGQLVFYWAVSIRPSPGEDFATWVRNAAVPFTDVQRALATFVEGYAAEAGRPLDGPGGCRSRIVRFAGVFLMHRALATLEAMGVMSGGAYCCLLVGKTLLSSPERSIEILFGKAP